MPCDMRVVAEIGYVLDQDGCSIEHIEYSFRDVIYKKSPEKNNKSIILTMSKKPKSLTWEEKGDYSWNNVKAMMEEARQKPILKILAGINPIGLSIEFLEMEHTIGGDAASTCCPVCCKESLVGYKTDHCVCSECGAEFVDIEKDCVTLRILEGS